VLWWRLVRNSGMEGNSENATKIGVRGPVT
jgi:hypothetical protein